MSKRRQAATVEEATHDSTTWTQAIVESAVDGIITIDETGKIEHFNRAAERMFGYTAAEVVGHNVNMLMPEPMRSEHDVHLSRYRDTGKKHIIGLVRELEGRHKNGRVFPFEISISEVSLGNRRIFTAILHDISARKRNQEEKDRLFRDLNKRNMEISSLYRVGEIIRSGQDMPEICRRVSEEVRTAFARPEAIGTVVRFDGEAYHCAEFKETPWRMVADIMVAGRKRGDVEVDYLERPVNHCDPFLPQERDLISAIAAALAEMVERRDAESKVIQASKLASIGELAAGVGHEINNPLNGIINCADILIQVLTDRPKDRQFAELIRSEAERIARIVQNLLTFSRQDRESHSPARLLDIVDAVLSLSRKKIAKSHVRLTVDVPEDLPKVKCRSEQMQQVLMNLIINALHALDDKYPVADAGKVLHITARQHEIDSRPWLRLTVEDHGAGIAPIHMDRLFDPFFTTKSREVGTGLGLSVSDGIVKDHGGRITVESEIGKFARFHVDLPLDNGWISTSAVTD
ncbi:MAG: PAS domain S-box protein [Candidatus Hydrogenedentes bacterium]|nr:PAS domain S-box protein [Candidatus Hydrogenedentota bacterium]